MDSLFAVRTRKTVWRTLINRQPMEEILEERRRDLVLYGKKDEAGLEQLESVDRSRKYS